MNVLSEFCKIDTFILDIDGVLTNGNLLVMDNGSLLRSMNIKDGYALQHAIKNKYHIIIISGAKNEGLELRLKGLGLAEMHFGIHDKKTLLEQLIAEKIVNATTSIYMGDDKPDVPCMQMVHMACAPADACQQALAVAHYVSPLAGGAGCVRDVIEKVMVLRGNWD
jgi:3-deoxy-D-manno-octulosonate 8-phosphate phosphatase (KDO 8-P phosphatase)